MFKKITVTAALSTTLIFGGVFTTSVDASTNTDQSQSQPGQTYTTHYTLNGNQNLTFDNRINDLFTHFYNNGYNNQEDSSKNQSNNTTDKQASANQHEQVTQQPKEHSNKPSQESEQTQQQSNQSSQSTLPELSQYEQQVVDLTNEERADHGLEPLKVDKELSRVAREKSNDMSTSHYFDHTSPTYGSPFDMMKSYGISYSTAGENIAKGQPTPEEVVNAWMNSEGHRANILNQDFTQIGVGYVEQGNHWTQQFIGK